MLVCASVHTPLQSTQTHLLCAHAPTLPCSGEFESVMAVSEHDLQLPLPECYSGYCSNCTARVSVRITASHTCSGPAWHRDGVTSVCAPLLGGSL